MPTRNLSNAVLALFLLLFIASACGDTTDSIPAIEPDTGKSYYFLEEGQFREYDVYEIRYLAVDISDTSQYQIREEVKESFVSNGITSNIIHRFRRENVSQAWELDSVWSARVETDRAVSVENNIPIVKMVFPSVQERKWNGNAFNTRAEDEFRIITFSAAQDEENNTSFQVPIPGSAISFSEVMVVEQHNDEDMITFRDNRVEVYKDSIGLVFKQYDVVKICSRAECLGQELVESGRFYRELLTSEGKIDGAGG
ncbi:MAG: hypothetical protein HEP71_26210 [Roseivirga sp.]|nr:hypothetical protein [Roseivirga sp.]